MPASGKDDFHACRRLAAPAVRRLSQIVLSGNHASDARFVMAKEKLSADAT